MIEDTLAFQKWAEVLVIVEERLGIVTCDDALIRGRQHCTDLTLRDAVGLVESQLSVEAVASGQASAIVLEAASRVAGRDVPLATMGEPILKSLGLSYHTPR